MERDPTDEDGVEPLTEGDRAVLPAIEAARALLLRGEHAEALGSLAGLAPRDLELQGVVVDLRLEAALALRDLVSLETMAAQAEALGSLRPEEARRHMLDAEAAGALELARALARGLREHGEDVSVISKRLESGRSARTRAVKLLGNAALALGDAYQDLRLIGTGRISYVVSAHSLARHQRVACKFLNPGIDVTEQARTRFEREAEVLRQLDHPGILRLLSHGMEDPLHLITEFFPGASLSALIEQGRRLDSAQLGRLARDLVAAVEHAHAKGVIHRDIQASNVLKDRAGAIKLIDFGLARLVESAGVTFAGSALGDWRHHPPELFSGSAPAPTIQMDVFGIGVTLYEAATGSAPYARVKGFTRIPAPDIAVAAAELPTGLQEVIRRALAEEPEARWQSVSGMRQPLEQDPD